MARINKKKQRDRERQARREERWLRHTQEDANGAGTKPYQIKCEACGLVQRGGEQYHDPRRPITPCPCGHEIALNEPQLR